VLVTSAEERAALAACRSLFDAGYSVTAVAHERPAAAHWSRCCTARDTTIDPKADPDAFVDALVNIVSRTPHRALLPANDAALLAVSPRRERLEPHVELGLPPHEAVEAATDKIALHEAAAAAGLDAPETAICATPEEGYEAVRRLGLPIVIKPRRSVFEDGGTIRQRGSRLLAHADDLEPALTEHGNPFLLQRTVPGEVWSAAGVLAVDGELLSLSVSRYVRTWPVEGGNVAFAEMQREPEGLRDRVAMCLRNLGWTEIFELELIRTPEGMFHAIDLNPRLYGSLAHAGRAGAPHAAIFVDALLGRRRPFALARAGTLYRWEDADLRHAIADVRGGRLGAAARIVAPRRHVAHALLRRDDPGPLAARALNLALHRRPDRTRP
jgi:predicted ATP-grasp superfamily ATP-dependent carboligase